MQNHVIADAASYLFFFFFPCSFLLECFTWLRFESFDMETIFNFSHLC